MKNIKNIIKLSLLAVVVATSSCSDFLDVNKDPNRVTDSNITPQLIFTQAENAIGTRQATRFVFMNNWMGYWARSGSFIVEQEETTYKVTSTFTEGNWDQAYNILFDLYKVKSLALTANDSVLAGASIILSTKLWQETVDQFGAIPYSQAFDHLKYPTPVYDPAATIYADLLVQLDKAISYLQATPKTSMVESFAKADMIFARGNSDFDVATSWKRLANTIKLRIFLRQSASGFVPSAAQLAKIGTDGGFLGAGEDVAVNPGYSNQTDKQNPFYAAFGLTPSGSAASTNNKANAYFYNLTDNYRYDRFYAAPVTPTYYGALNGNKVSGGSQIAGTDIGPGLAGTSMQDQWILPAFESLFFQAEASARGWAVSSLPTDSLYKLSVRQSFKWLGVADADKMATEYLYSPDFGARWEDAGTTSEDHVQFIAFQKYLSMCGIDPMEEWADLRRGVLVLPSGYLSWNSVRASHLPWVLPYPQSEITTNAAKVPARSGDQIFTEKLFWQP